MKRQSLKSTLIWLRICIVSLILCLLSLVLFSFTAARMAADDLWKQLGITQQQGTEKVRNTFIYGYLETYGMKSTKSIAAGNRATLAKDLMVYAKNYVKTPAFKTAWSEQRAVTKPIAPEQKSFTKEDIRKEKIAEVNKWIKQGQDLIKQMPQLEKDMKKNMEEYNKILADYKDPNSKQIEMIFQDKLRTQKDDWTYYEGKLKKWEAEMPVDFNVQLKKHLVKYLETANTVDFDAELTDRYGKKVFVKQEYERKHPDWKKIFRAGKEVHEVAKPFAEQWLKEL